MASFCPMSLMMETPEVIERFVAYYLEAGADEIRVYCDGPVPEMAITAPGVQLIACDAAFWESLGGRPDGLEARQSAVYLHGTQNCGTDWALIIDADEFVFGNRSIPEFLDLIPARYDAVSLPTAEAVWGPGDDLTMPFGSTHFRLVWRSNRLWATLGRVTYGKVSRQMQRGLAGHVSGKEFIRARKPYSWIRNHSAQRDGKGITRPAASIDPALAGMYLGHFDAIGLERWAEKWRRRIEKDTLAFNMTANRTAQMQTVARHLKRGPSATQSLFAKVYGLSRGQYALLSALGYAFRREIFPAGT